MKQDTKNRIRISPLQTRTLRPRGRYRLQIQRRWLCFWWWEDVWECYSINGVWNIVLRKYEQAVLLAKELTDPEAYAKFVEEQEEISRRWNEIRLQEYRDLYPVQKQEF